MTFYDHISSFIKSYPHLSQNELISLIEREFQEILIENIKDLNLPPILSKMKIKKLQLRYNRANTNVKHRIKTQITRNDKVRYFKFFQNIIQLNSKNGLESNNQDFYYPNSHSCSQIKISYVLREDERNSISKIIDKKEQHFNTEIEKKKIRQELISKTELDKFSRKFESDILQDEFIKSNILNDLRIIPEKKQKIMTNRLLKIDYDPIDELLKKYEDYTPKKKEKSNPKKNTIIEIIGMIDSDELTFNNYDL